MRNFSIVGSLENLDKFRGDFKKKFGKRVHIRHLNITQKKQKREWEHIPDVIHKKVIQICQPDIEVYKSINWK